MRGILSLLGLLVVVGFVGCKEETPREVQRRKRKELETLQEQLASMRSALDGSGKYTVHVYDGSGWSGHKRDTPPECSCRFGELIDRRERHHRAEYTIHVGAMVDGQQHIFDNRVRYDWNVDLDIAKMDATKLFRTQYKDQVFVWHQPPKKQDGGAWEIKGDSWIFDDGFVTTALDAAPIDDELFRQAKRDHEHNQDIWVKDRWQCEKHCPPETGQWASEGYKARHSVKEEISPVKEERSESGYKYGRCE